MELNNVKNQNSLLKAYNMLLYFAGSMVMNEPVEECVVDFWSNGILKALPVKSSNPRFIEAASQLRESCQDKTLCSKILQDDFKRLFAYSEVPLAPPRKSDYTDITLQNLTGTEGVTDFYNSYGWEKRSKYNIPDDNLGMELLFLTLLNDRYIALDDSACRTEMRKEIRRFVDLHIMSWLPEWYSRMQEYAGTLCYKGIATLIFASCEDIYSLLDDTNSENESATEFRN
jgi:TorA maturation chaperone TorD